MSDKTRDNNNGSDTSRTSLADSTSVTLIVAALLAGVASYALHELRPSDFLSGLTSSPANAQRPVRVAQAPSTDQSGTPRNLVSETATTTVPASDEPADWVAAAPGRIEPRGGETRLMVETPGRIAAVYAELGDTVVAGDILLVIDDRDVRAKISALRTNEQTLRKDRDDVAATSKLVQDRRKRSDELADAERALSNARLALDDAVTARRAGSGTPATVDSERAKVASAEKAVVDARAELAQALSVANLPAPSRLEATLATARSELSLAEIALDRHRMRSPISGQVIELNAKAGEMAAPTQMQPPIVLGDMAGRRVRAEVEERDLAKIQVGQRVTARSTAFPGQNFDGKVATIAPALGAPRLVARGPRKPNDVDVLEVLIDLEGKPPLKPGQRVDVYFTKADGS